MLAQLQRNRLDPFILVHVPEKPKSLPIFLPLFEDDEIFQRITTTTETFQDDFTAFEDDIVTFDDDITVLEDDLRSNEVNNNFPFRTTTFRSRAQTKRKTLSVTEKSIRFSL